MLGLHASIPLLSWQLQVQTLPVSRVGLARHLQLQPPCSAKGQHRTPYFGVPLAVCVQLSALQGLSPDPWQARSEEVSLATYAGVFAGSVDESACLQLCTGLLSQLSPLVT